MGAKAIKLGTSRILLGFPFSEFAIKLVERPNKKAEGLGRSTRISFLRVCLCQQQTQPTYDVQSGNRTREASALNHCTIPALLIAITVANKQHNQKSRSVFANLILLLYYTVLLTKIQKCIFFKARFTMASLDYCLQHKKKIRTVV